MAIKHTTKVVKYTHIIIGDILHSLGTWIKEKFLEKPDADIIYSTYEKFVIDIMDDSVDKYKRLKPPFVIFDPTGDLQPEEHSDFLWRYAVESSKIPAGLPYKLFNPIYKDDNVMIVPIYQRFSGEINITVFCRSVSEYLDFRTKIYQVFGRLNMANILFKQQSNVVVRADILNPISNDIKNTVYEIDSSKFKEKTLMTTGNIEKTFTIETTPIFYFASVSDNSNKYGSSTSLPEWALTFTIKYEVEIPAYFIVISDYKLENIVAETKDKGAVESDHNLVIPNKIKVCLYSYNSESGKVEVDEVEADIEKTYDIYISDNIIYENDPITFTLPFEYDENKMVVKVYIDNTELKNNDEYIIDKDNNEISFYVTIPGNSNITYAVYSIK